MKSYYYSYQMRVDKHISILAVTLTQNDEVNVKRVTFRPNLKLG